ncbi:MAG TPA: hypothetical protein DEO40_05620 [Treponema sp.]|nr:hypothetical protein [Treponema sp.]
MIIGTKKDKKIMAKKAINPHILVTGMSGMGKTWFCQSTLVQRAEEGERVLVFNYHQVCARDQMHPEVRKRYDSLVNIIKVREGIPLPLFTPFVSPTGKVEAESATMHRICNILQVAGKLTEPQARDLFAAVKDAFSKNLYAKCGIVSVAKKLELIGTGPSIRTLGNLRAVFDNNVFVDGDMLESEKPIIELDFEGIEYDEQKAVVRLVCDFYLRLAMTMQFSENPLTLFIDECQNLDYGRDSTMFTIVNEGRKLGLTLLLATPSILSSKKDDMRVLNQFGTRIVFKPLPNELTKTADILDRRRKIFLTFELSDLERGKFICGTTVQGANDEDNPFDVLSTYLPGESS